MTTKQIEERSRIIMAISLEANCSIKEAAKIARHLKKQNTRMNWWHTNRHERVFFENYWKMNAETGEYENRLLKKLEQETADYITKKIGCEFEFNGNGFDDGVILLRLKNYSNRPERMCCPNW